MRHSMSRRLLQIFTVALGLLTVVLASMQLAMGARSPIYAHLTLPDAPVLDSNLRFFAGLGLGLGLTLIWIAPKIERHAILFRVVWGCALLGGLGRLLSMILIGKPSLPLIVFTFIELPLVPVFIYWQHCVASAPRAQDIASDI